jgi:hypothetical protein
MINTAACFKRSSRSIPRIKAGVASNRYRQIQPELGLPRFGNSRNIETLRSRGGVLTDFDLNP